MKPFCTYKAGEGCTGRAFISSTKLVNEVHHLENTFDLYIADINDGYHEAFIDAYDGTQCLENIGQSRSFEGCS